MFFVRFGLSSGSGSVQCSRLLLAVPVPATAFRQLLLNLFLQSGRDGFQPVLLFIRRVRRQRYRLAVSHAHVKAVAQLFGKVLDARDAHDCLDVFQVAVLALTA